MTDEPTCDQVGTSMARRLSMMPADTSPLAMNTTALLLWVIMPATMPEMAASEG